VSANYLLYAGLFQEVDVDGGGELDQNEFAVLLEKVGVEVDPLRLQVRWVNATASFCLNYT